MYVRPQRHYRNKQTGATSPLLHEVISDRATLVRNFDCGARQGTWTGTPFEEVEHVPPLELVPGELKALDVQGGGLSVEEAVPMLFDAIMNSIERAWNPFKQHVVFHSSGWDSRIISAAIKQLNERQRSSLVGSRLFLANRWEANEAYEIVVNRQGWQNKEFVAYADGPPDEHFAPCLDFGQFWRTANAPLPICGNLWWYLPEWAQAQGLLPGDGDLQGFSGLWANETWNWWNRGGPQGWLAQCEKQYYYTAMATYPQKIPLMEYPLTDLEVLKIVVQVEGTSGDRLRQAVANYACPEAVNVAHHRHDDRGYVNGRKRKPHPVSDRLRQRCVEAYKRSWYARHVKAAFGVPSTSEYNPGWCRWGLASLVEELVRRGVDVR